MHRKIIGIIICMLMISSFFPSIVNAITLKGILANNEKNSLYNHNSLDNIIPKGEQKNRVRRLSMEKRILRPYALQLKLNNIKTVERYKNEIFDVFKRHKEDINEINRYAEKYIEKNGCIDKNFALTDDLQLKFDVMLNEMSINKPSLGKVWNGISKYKPILDQTQRLKQPLHTLKSDSVLDKLVSNSISQNMDKYYLTFETVPGGCTVVVNSVGSKKTSCEDEDCTCGYCTFYDLDEGYYTWTVSKSGYKSESGRKYLECDTKIVVVLEEDDGDDGITKLEFQDYRINTILGVIYLGWELKCWMNHDYIVNNLNPASGAGIAGIALLLVALGLESYGVMWIFAAWLIGSGINTINNVDEGRGVYIHCKLTVMGMIWPPKVTPQ